MTHTDDSRVELLKCLLVDGEASTQLNDVLLATNLTSFINTDAYFKGEDIVEKTEASLSLIDLRRVAILEGTKQERNATLSQLIHFHLLAKALGDELKAQRELTSRQDKHLDELDTDNTELRSTIDSLRERNENFRDINHKRAQSNIHYRDLLNEVKALLTEFLDRPKAHQTGPESRTFANKVLRTIGEFDISAE